MKYFLLFFLSLTVTLSAFNEFKYIQPLSVEKHPNAQIKPSSALNLEPKKEKKTHINNYVKPPVNDRDKDGVEDSLDMCLNTHTFFQVDKNGCPESVLIDIELKKSRYSVPKESALRLKKLTSFLKMNKNYQVIIYGYTDNIGDDARNKKLSYTLANKIKKSLMKNGISSTKLTSIGKGEKFPIADNITKAGRDKNLRVEIELIK